jgi:hypothetical protein
MRFMAGLVSVRKKEGSDALILRRSAHVASTGHGNACSNPRSTADKD